MSIESLMPSNHLILYHPLRLLPSIFLSIRVFSNESVLCIRWPKYWNFSFSPSNEYSGLISFRFDGFDLHAIQGTLKSLIQHHSSKVSILLHSTFFMVQLLHPYMTPGQTIAFTIWTFVFKVMSLLFIFFYSIIFILSGLEQSQMSLLFNMLSRLVITFLPRSKHLIISWLQSPSAVILEPKTIVCHCFPIYLP